MVLIVVHSWENRSLCTTTGNGNTVNSSSRPVCFALGNLGYQCFMCYNAYYNDRHFDCRWSRGISQDIRSLVPQLSLVITFLQAGVTLQ